VEAGAGAGAEAGAGVSRWFAGGLDLFLGVSVCVGPGLIPRLAYLIHAAQGPREADLVDQETPRLPRAS